MLTRIGQIIVCGIPFEVMETDVITLDPLPTPSAEYPLNESLQVLNSFDGLHLVWKHKKKSKIFPADPTSSASSSVILPLRDVTFTVKFTSSERMTFSLGSTLKMTGHLPQVNYWFARCRKLKDRTMEVFGQSISCQIGKVEIFPLVERNASVVNCVSGRRFGVIKDERQAEPALLIYDEADRSSPVAEACTSGKVELPQIQNFGDITSHTDYSGFKLLFNSGGNLTVTDKALMMALLVAWVIDFKELKRQGYCQSLTQYLLLMVIITSVITIGILAGVGYIL